MKFKNIETANFKAHSSETAKRQVIISENSSGVFYFSRKSITWLLAGIQAILSDSEIMFGVEAMGFVTKMSLHGMQNDDTKTDLVELTRNEVLMYKSYLEDAMDVQEALRDNRDNSFDADAYIEMKYMLLDLKIWLMGDVIAEQPAAIPQQYSAGY